MPTTNPRAETALKELVDRVPDVVFRYRLQPERGVEYISDAATRVVGYTPEEYYADPDLVAKTVHPDDRTVLAELARPSGRTRAVVRWRRKDGTLAWVEQRVTPVYDEAGQVVAIDGVVREIADPTLAPGGRVRMLGDVRIDLVDRRVTIGQRDARLTPAELKLLVLLTERPGEVVTRERMMRDLWNSAHVGTGHTCEAHISNLRRKIEPDPRNPTRIVTVRGGGYRFATVS